MEVNPYHVPAKVEINASLGRVGVQWILLTGSNLTLLSGLTFPNGLGCKLLLNLRLQFYNLQENVLQDVFGVPLIYIQLWHHPQNLATFLHVEVKIIVCA